MKPIHIVGLSVLVASVGCTSTTDLNNKTASEPPESPKPEITAPNETVSATAEGFATFADWCLNRESLSPNALHTVELLLEKAGTQDCSSAQESLGNLSDLMLSNSQVIELAPLASLTHLSRLDLSRNQILDVAPLANLTNLTGLYLSDNEIVDVAPLNRLNRLSELSLAGNNIADVAPLANLTNLATLDLYNNAITDVTPLAALSELTLLYLGENPLSDRTCPLQPETICIFSNIVP
ncbi:MAG: leucine-rich repeat domain-containing protein [Cyanobacteria bacterium J06639_16]